MARTITARRKAQQARHALATITDSQMAAWTDLDDITASDLTATVSECLSASEAYRADVESYGWAIAASLLPGAESVRHAARAAVRIARKRVSEAYSLDISLDAWASGPDALEDALQDGEARPGSLTTDPVEPERVCLPTGLDHAVASVWSLARRGMLSHADARLWTDALASYADHVMAHGSACPVCKGRPATKRPTLSSVLAHEIGETSSGATGKRTARTLARVAEALLSAGVRDDLTRDPRGRSSVRLGHDQSDYFGASLASLVVTPEGPRTLTPLEVWGVVKGNAWAVPVDWTEYAADPRHDPARGAETTLDGRLRPGARPAPRKRSGSSGATGPTLPARF